MVGHVSDERLLMLTIPAKSRYSGGFHVRKSPVMLSEVPRRRYQEECLFCHQARARLAAPQRGRNSNAGGMQPHRSEGRTLSDQRPFRRACRPVGERNLIISVKNDRRPETGIPAQNLWQSECRNGHFWAHFPE